MTKTIFFNIPATGHVNPTLPLIKELVQRGEEIICVNAEEYRHRIEATGARFTPYPDALALERLIKETAAEGNIIWNMYELIRISGQLLPFTLELIDREQPDYLMHGTLASWAKIAARKRALASVTTVATFAMNPGARPSVPLRTLFDVMVKMLLIVPRYFTYTLQFRRQHGIFPVMLTEAVMSLGDLNIVFTSREFQPASEAFADNFKFVGTAIAPRPFDGDFPFDLLDVSPLVYISLGTISQNLHFFRQCFEAFSSRPGRYIIATGHQIDLASLGDIPANFIVRNFVPQLELLPRVDVFITHGGLNSIHEGLTNGVPMVIVPQHMEQALGAQQVVKHGAGLGLQMQPPYGRVTADQLRGAVDELLRSPAYAENAARIGKTLANAGGARRAADEILNFVRTRP